MNIKTSYIKFIRKNYEKYYPLVFSLLCTYILYGCIGYFIDKKLLITEISKNSLQFSGVLLGFFLTIKTIIGSVNNNATKAIQANPARHLRFIRYLDYAIWYNFLLIPFAFIFAVINWEKILLSKKTLLFNSSFLFITFFACFTFWVSFRFIKLFIMLMKPEVQAPTNQTPESPI